MTKYYIDLGDNSDDRIDLASSDVDTVNYDNNYGYNVYAIAICDESGDVIESMFFADQDARDEYESAKGLECANYEWIVSEGFEITCDNGSWAERIPCKCNIQYDYCI